jgi:hypothetical protein
MGCVHRGDGRSVGSFLKMTSPRASANERVSALDTACKRGLEGPAAAMDLKETGRKVAEVADPGHWSAAAEERRFAGETAIVTRCALQFSDQRAKNVRTTATNLRAGRRPFHKCTGNPVGTHLADETTDTCPLVRQAW